MLLLVGATSVAMVVLLLLLVLVLVLVLAAEAGAAVMPPRRLSPAKTIPAVTAAERLPNRCMIPPLTARPRARASPCIEASNPDQTAQC